MTARTSAALRLRGRDGPLRAELTWPPGHADAVLVFIDDGHGEAACRALGDALNAVTLSAACATHHDARAAVEWTADHTDQLGATPARLTLAGHGAGAELAAAEAPPWLERLVLVQPRFDGEPPVAPVPTVIAAAGEDGDAYAERLRAAGVAVTLLDDLAGLAAAVR